MFSQQCFQSDWKHLEVFDNKELPDQVKKNAKPTYTYHLILGDLLYNVS